jgi:hypothetical protein
LNIYGTLNDGANAIAVNGNWTVSGGSLTCGAITVNSGGSLTVANGTLTAGALIMYNGSLTFNSGATATFSGGTTIDGGSLTINSGATATFSGGLLLNSSGPFTALPGSTVNIPGAITGYGTCNITGGNFALGGGTENVPVGAYTSLSLSGGGTYSLASGTSVSGNLSIASGTKVSVASGVNVNVGNLTLGGVAQASGTWGYSGRTHNNTTYFANTTGYLTVQGGTASKLVFTTSPVTVTAGVASGNITVQRQDAGGNPITAESSTRTVTLTSSSSGTKTFTPSSSLTIANGSSSASFTYTDTQTGTPTLTAASTSPGTITPATQLETVTPAAASKLVFTTSPVTVAAGVASGNLTVQRQDQYGNPNTTDATRAVTLTSTSSGTKTFSPASPLSINSGSSSASFTYTDTQAGSPTLTAASTSPSTITPATQQETVNAGTPSASQSTLTASLPSVPADGTTTSTITVTLKDANGNPAAGKTVSLTKTSGAGTPTITTIAGTTAANGQGSWTVKSTTATPAAPDVFTALDSSDNVTVTPTASVTFTPGAMTHYAVTFSTPPFYAGGTWTTYATAQDAYGNTVTSASGTVTFSSSSSNMKWDGNHNGALGNTPPDNQATLSSGVASIPTGDPTVETGVTTTASNGTYTGTSAPINTVIQAGAYQSVQTGNWGDASTWQVYSGSSWGAASTPPSADTAAAVSVLSTHTVTVAASVSVNHVFVNNGGTLVVSSGVGLTLVNTAEPGLVVFGSLINNGTVTVSSGATLTVHDTGELVNSGTVTTSGTLTFMGGTYQHDFTTTAGTIPAATWSSGSQKSTCQIIGYTSNTGTPGGLSQSFQTFVWNCPSQTANISLGGSQFTTLDTFTVSSTGSGAITLGANLTLTNTAAVMSGATLNCGVYVISQASAGSASYFDLQAGGTLGIGSTAGITASGTGGNIQTTTHHFSPSANYVYNGTAAQVTGDGPPAAIYQLTINNSAGVTLSEDLAVNNILALTSGALAIGAHTLTVNNAISTIGGGTLTGGGSSSIVVGDNGSSPGTTLPAVAAGLLNLTVNRANGVALGDGVVVSGTLTLISGALAIGANTLTLNNAISATGGTLTGGGGSSLVIGDAGSALSATLPAVASGLLNLTVNRASGVTLSSSLEISGSLTLTTGGLVTGANQVNLDAGAAWGRTSGWVNGTLQMAFNAGSGQSFTFPIGGQRYYQPVALANLNVTTAGTLAGVVTASAGNHPQITGSGINPNHDLARYWTLTPGSGLAVSSYNASFTFDPSDVSSGATTGNFVIREYSGGAWHATITASQNPTSTEATGLTAPFGDFIIGDPLASQMIVTLPTQTFTTGSGNSGTVINQIAGAPFNLTLTAVDVFNVIDPTYSGVKTISYTGPGNSPSGAAPIYIANVTFTSGQAASIATTLKKAETRTIAATDNILTGVASSSLTVNPASVSASGSTVSASPASVPADGATTSAITVTLKDAYGNPVSGKAVSLAMTSGSGSPIITATQGTTGGSGVATFTVKSTTAAADAFTATDTTDSSLAITQTATVTFTSGALDHFVFSPSPITGTYMAGTPITGITITAQDVNNNAVTTFAGQLTYGGTAGVTGHSGIFASGVLSGASITPIKAGNNLTVTVVDANGHTGSTTIATVNPAPFNHYAVTFSTPPFYAEGTWTTYATAEDAYGNTVTNASGTVTFSSSSSNMKWDGNHDGTYGNTSPENQTTLTNGVANISTGDPTVETGVTTTASDGTHAGTSAPIDIVTQNGAYQSVKTGNWGEASTWQVYSGGSWGAASIPPSDATAASVTVLSTHTVTVAANVSVNHVFVNTGGALVVSSDMVLTLANTVAPGLVVYGSLTNNGTITVTSGAMILVHDTGVLVNSGTVTTSGTLTFLGGTYQHDFTTTAGAIPVATWSSGSQDSTCEIIGYTSNTGTPGGLNQNFQSFVWNCPNQTGDISLGSGFTSANDFTVNSTGTGSIAVLLGANLAVANATTIASGAALYCGPYVLSGGSFTLDAGGILGIGSPAGITASAAAGNIQTATRSFDAGGFYIYNGTAAQMTGDGLPSRVGHLTINNSTGVALSADVAVAYQLSLNSGALSIGGHTLTLRNSVTVGAGSLTGGSSSSLYIGDVGDAAATTLPGVSGGLQNLTLDRAAGAMLSGPVTVSGTYTAMTGTLSGANNLTFANGCNLVCYTGALSGTPTFSGLVNLTYMVGGYVTGSGLPGATSVLNNLTLANPSGAITLSADATVNGTLTIGSGATLADGGNTLTVKGNVANSGTNSGSGEILLAGSALQTLSGVGTYGNLELNNASGASLSAATTVTGTLTLTAGALGSATNLILASGTSIIRALGSLSGLPTFSGTVNVSYTMGGVTTGTELPISTGNVLQALSFNNSSGTITLGAAATVNGTLTINTGSTVADGGYALTTKGDVINDGVQGGSGEVRLDNPSSQMLYGSGTYGNLELYQGDANLAGSPILNGTLTLPSGGQTGLFVVGANTLTLNGPAMAGTLTDLATSSDSSLVFGGSSAGVQIPGSVATLNNLTINNASGVTMNSSITMIGTLTLASGRLNTGANILHLNNANNDATALTFTPGSGWINGSLSKTFAVGNGQSFTYPIGGATSYRPVVWSTFDVLDTGEVQMRVIEGAQAQIASSGLTAGKVLQAYWTATITGRLQVRNASATFNFVAADVPVGADPSQFVLRLWESEFSLWVPVPTGTRGAYSIQGIELRTASTATGDRTTYSDFVVGDQLASAYQITASTGTPAPGVADPLTLTLMDALKVPVSYSGDKSLTFSGLSRAGDGTYPTVTDKNGAAVPLGTATTISFASGVSSAGGSLVAYKAEGPVTLNATDGAAATTNPGGNGASLTIPNVAPVGGTYFFTATVNTPLVLSVSTLEQLSFDANHDSLTFTAVGATSQSGSGTSVALTGGGATITYSPGTYVGADQFTFTISDGNGGTATSTAKVTVGLGQVTCLFNYISPPTNHIVYLRGHGIPLHSYDLQKSPDMQTWSKISSVLAVANGIILCTDTNASGDQAYYRFAVPQ